MFEVHVTAPGEDPQGLAWYRDESVIPLCDARRMFLERLLELGVWAAVWSACLASILLTLSWIARRSFWYRAVMRELADERVPPGALIFIGTSTFRLWDSLASDFAPWPVRNRGFGGAVVSQCVHYVSSLVPDDGAPAALIFYAGANDLAWFVRSSKVVADIERFIDLARERAPATPFYLVSLCKSPGRFLSWRRVDKINESLKAVAARKSVRFVDVASQLVGTNGWPRRDLFADGIHPSEKGYAIWTATIRRHLEADLAGSIDAGA